MGLGYNPGSSTCPAARVASPRRAAFNFAPILAMSEILKLRGAPAFSSSRLARLTDQVRAALPRLKGLAAEHWYFVEVNAPLSAEEQARLAADPSLAAGLSIRGGEVVDARILS